MFANLPTELKLQILEEVDRTSTGSDITNVLRVSKQWNKLATPLLWTNIVLHNDNYVAFVRSLSIARKYLGQEVHTLSIRLHPISYSDQPFTKPWMHLGFPGDRFRYENEDEWQTSGPALPAYLSTVQQANLSAYIKKTAFGNMCLAVASYDLARLIKEQLRMLTTFSFRYAAWPTREHQDATNFKEGGPQVEIPAQMVSQLIEALPVTCSQLEVESSGQDQMFGTRDKPHELSQALESVLPRLEHLSLEAAHVSSFVYGNLLSSILLPRLRSLRLEVTNLVLTEDEYAILSNATSILPGNMLQREPSGQFDALQSSVNSRALQRLITSGLRAGIAENRFPAMERMILRVIQSTGSDAGYDEYLRCEIDVLNGNMYVTPMACIPGASRILPYEAWAFYDGQNGKLLFMEETEADACGDMSWLSSTAGVRMPASAGKARSGLEFDTINAGMELDEYLAWAKRGSCTQDCERVETALRNVVGKIRKPYVVEGLEI